MSAAFHRPVAALSAPQGRRLIMGLKWAGGAILTVWGLLLLAWMVLHWAILPHLAQWRGTLERHAGAALGVPVRIGSIVAHSGGWATSFELRDVALLDIHGTPALTLPRVVAALSLRSLLVWTPHFEQLLIDGAELEIRRDARGHLLIAGLDFSGAGHGHGGANWFFDQHEVVVRGGTLRWVDDRRQALPLALTDVVLRVRNSLRGHRIRIDATPPAAWGERFTLRGDFTHALLGERGDWQHWSGVAYAELPRADVSQLRRHVALPFELTRGDGALRAWVDLHDGQPRQATVDVALRAVALQLSESSAAAPLAPLALQRVQGRLSGHLDDEGGELTLQRFGFVTTDGVAWPRSDASLRWHSGAGQQPLGGDFKADRLDLALMSQVAERLPFGPALRHLLAQGRPEGSMRGVQFNWRGAVGAPTHYTAKARLQGLSLASQTAAVPGDIGRPGVHNANVDLVATEAGGEAQLAIDQGALDLPGVFAEPLVPLARWRSGVIWRIGPATPTGKTGTTGAPPPNISVQVKDARFANADANGELQARWSNGGAPGGPGLLTLDGRLFQGNAARVARYLPLQLPAETRDYVAQAVRSGRLSNLVFHVKGDLAEFPFGPPKPAANGEFRIHTQVEDTTFAFVPGVAVSGPAPATGWPALTGLTGELVFDRTSMEIRHAQAQLGGVALQHVQGGIHHLADNAVLTLQGSGRGALADMLRFVNTTPVSEWTGRALSQTKGSGSADLRLALAIPLARVAASTVNGSLMLAGNEVRWRPDAPALSSARGRIDFSNKGFALTGVTARFLGGDSTLEGGLQGDGGVRLQASGSLTADALRRTPELGAVSRLAGAMSGQTRYKASLALLHGVGEIQLTSNLAGLALDLPSPLRKPAEAPLALRVQALLAADAGAPPGVATRDTLRFELGNVVQALYQRDLTEETPRVLRGAIGIMEPPPALPASGVAASVAFNALALDPWQALATRLSGPSPAVATLASTTPTTGAVTPTSASPGSAYAPTSLAVRAQSLLWSGKRLSHVVAGLSFDDGFWRANVASDQLGGYVEYRVPRRSTAGAAGRVVARLAHLSLQQEPAENAEPLLETPPASVPALDITVDELTLRGKRLGRVEIEAVNRLSSEGRDAGREWRLNRLVVTTPEARLSASGVWAASAGGAPNGRRRTLLDFKLDLADSGALLDRLGQGRTLRSGKGTLTGQVDWLGSPLAIDYPSLNGQLNVALGGGQFLKAEPGAARLLGVLNLQALPRRLLLDFRDVFQQGFAFDAITGDVDITHGQARTSNLRMRGVQATVLMEGSANLERETQDLRVAVVPEINAGTASLAYAAINPALGIGTFLAQLMLRKPLQAAGTREFHVSGPWAEPKVDKIERTASTNLPAAEATAVP